MITFTRGCDRTDKFAFPTKVLELNSKDSLFALEVVFDFVAPGVTAVEADTRLLRFEQSGMFWQFECATESEFTSLLEDALTMVRTDDSKRAELESIQQRIAREIRN